MESYFYKQSKNELSFKTIPNPNSNLRIPTTDMKLLYPFPDKTS